MGERSSVAHAAEQSSDRWLDSEVPLGAHSTSWNETVAKTSSSAGPPADGVTRRVERSV